MDPNTLNLDPDTGFWTNLDPDPGPDSDPGLYYQFWMKKLKIILEKKMSYNKSVFLTTIRTKCQVRKFLLNWVWIGSLYLNLTPF